MEPAHVGSSSIRAIASGSARYGTWFRAEARCPHHAEVGGFFGMAWIITIALFFGSGFTDGERGKATWYGSTSGRLNYCYGGYRNTCTPYSSGEQIYYAATGSYKNYQHKPYEVIVENLANGRKIVVVVRDRCTGCRRDGTGGKIIDLSPAAFMYLSKGRLSLGVLKVRVYVKERNSNMEASNETRRARFLY